MVTYGDTHPHTHVLCVQNGFVIIETFHSDRCKLLLLCCVVQVSGRLLEGTMEGAAPGVVLFSVNGACWRKI
jgi:hypothetical protein